jgi:hypothetical protein
MRHRNLTTAELDDLLVAVTYMRGWSVHVYDGRHEGQHVVITATVPDAYDLTKTVTLDVHSMLPPMRDRAMFFDWLAWRLKRIAIHESREWFRVNGQVYDDPHGPDANQDR